VVAADQADNLQKLLTDAGETVYPMGHVTKGIGVEYAGQLL
jgi:phosphoribosylformylglycinamidine cyclo-ligase